MASERKSGGAAAVGLVLAAVALLLLALPASAGAYLYWANLSSTTVGRANIDGSGATQSFLTGAKAPSGVATDAQFVYWGNSSGGTIGRANLDGSGINQNFITGASTPGGIAVDAQHIYWVNFAGNTIGRANLDGTGVKQNFITGATNPRGVAVDAQHIYWTNLIGKTIGRANLDGSGVKQDFITVGTTEPAEIAVDAQHIYWANGEVGTIGRANLDGSGVNGSFIVIGGAKNLLGIAVDAQHIYWTNFSIGTIGRANIDGTGVNGSFITGATGPFGVTIDSLPHASATTIACTPATLTLPQTSTCMATVSDPDPGAFPVPPGPIAPTGTVTLSTGGGSFTPTASCSLTVVGFGQSACLLTFAPATAGNTAINGAYSGDATHSASGGVTTLRVKPRNTFTLRRKLNRKNGTATLIATVPGPGRLRLIGSGIKKISKRAKAAGKVKLKVKAKGRRANVLQEAGAAKVMAKVTYTPAGGDPRTKSVRLTLRLGQ